MKSHRLRHNIWLKSWHVLVIETSLWPLKSGRSISANAGVLLTKVEYLKPNPHKNFAIIDAAMNDMIRPALYQAWLNIEAVTPRTKGECKRWDFSRPGLVKPVTFWAKIEN